MPNALLSAQQLLNPIIDSGSYPNQFTGSHQSRTSGAGLPLSREANLLLSQTIAAPNQENHQFDPDTSLFPKLWSPSWGNVQAALPQDRHLSISHSFDSLLTPQRGRQYDQTYHNQTQPLVGIVDTGFSLSHLELGASGGELTLGHQHIYLGYDWIDGDRNPLTSEEPSSSHGSQVLEAFTQAAATSNLSSSNLWLGRAVGSGHWAASLVEFVATAKALGHHNAVANLSFELTEVQADGSLKPRSTLSETEIAALEFARQQGVIVVAAAGNENVTLSALAQASQQFDNILTVGAAERTEGEEEADRASYSNYGEGLSLLAEIPTSLQGSPQGTSLAASQVTQAVQTLWQQHRQLSYGQVISLLKNSAQDLQALGWDQHTGHGLLNLPQALRDASQETGQEVNQEIVVYKIEIKNRTVEIDAMSPDFVSPFNLLATPPAPWEFMATNPRYLERPLALEISQVTPGEGTTEIDLQASIQVQFTDETVDASTLTSESFRLLDRDGNAIAASLDSNLTGSIISLTPQAALNPFSTYSIVITNELLNSQGEAATPFSTSFTTGAEIGSSSGDIDELETQAAPNSESSLAFFFEPNNQNAAQSNSASAEAEGLPIENSLPVADNLSEANDSSDSIDERDSNAVRDNEDNTSPPINRDIADDEALPPPNVALNNFEFTLESDVYTTNRVLNLSSGQVQDLEGVRDIERIDFWLKNEDTGEWKDIADAVNFAWLGNNNIASFSSYCHYLTDYDFGNYLLWGRAIDRQGLVSESWTSSFVISAPPSELEFTLDSETYTTGDSLGLDSSFVQYTEGVSELARIDFWLRNESTGQWEDIPDATEFNPLETNSGVANFNTYNYDLSDYSPGDYVLWGRAIDQHGLSSRSWTRRFSIEAEPTGEIDFLRESFSVNEDDGTASIIVRRSGGSAGAQTVVITPTGGTAIGGEDYDATPIEIRFSDGEAGTRSVSLPIVDDSIFEASETVLLQLDGASVGEQNQATLILLEDDIPSIVLTPLSDNNPNTDEGGLRDGYQLVLTSQPTSNVDITIDFDNPLLSLNRPTLTLTPENWNVPQTVELSVSDGSQFEGTQSFNLSHTVSSGDHNYDGIPVESFDIMITGHAPSAGENALFVVGSTELSGADAIAFDLLSAKGYEVTVVDDDLSQTSNADDQDLILISQTVQSTKVNTKFTNSAVPIIVWESFLYDDLGLAENFGVVSNTSSLTLSNNIHPLSAGLPTGNTTIYSNSGEIGWGNPTNDNAISIAHVGNPNQLAVFGYEAGAALDGLVAPARRVGLSFWESPDTTGNNEAILDAAIDWAMEPSTTDATTIAPAIDIVPLSDSNIVFTTPSDDESLLKPAARILDLNWRPLNEPGSGGRISSVSFDPNNPDRILIGGDLLGVGLSQDRGQSWQRPTGFTTSFEIEEFTWDPINPDVVWAATREGPYLSQDGGQTWESRRQGMPAEFTNDAWLTSPIHKILYGSDGALLAFGGNHSEFNANDSSRFINYGAVWESRDNGESWSIRGRINPSDTGSGYNIKSVAYGAENQILYAAVESQGVYRSTDHGFTWSPVNGGAAEGERVEDSNPVTGVLLNDANDIAAHPEQANTLWVSTESGLYKTIDGGTTWLAIHNGLDASHIDGAWQVIKVAPSDPEVLLAGNYSDTVLYRSTDGGASWQSLETYPDTAFEEAITPHSLGFDPNDANRIIVGTYVTAFISEDQGETWFDATSQRANISANEWKGRGFAGWVGNNIEWNPYQPNQVIWQGFDEGTLWLSDDLEGWRNLREQPNGSLNEIEQFGGGWDVAFADDGKTIYTTLHQQFEDHDPRSRGIAKSLDGGKTWQYLDNQPGNIAHRTGHAYEIHTLPGNPDYLWVRVDQELWQSENGGESWNRIHLNGANVLDIAAPTDVVSDPAEALIYVATQSGVFQFQDNIWTALGGVGNGARVELEVDPHDASRLYLVNWHDFSLGGLYQFENGLWTQLSNEAYIRDVAVSPTNPDLLVAATNQDPFKMSNSAPGLLISEDRGQTWSLDNDGLGVIRAQTVEFSPEGDQVIVGTTGGGFFLSEVAVSNGKSTENEVSDDDLPGE